MLKLTKTLVIMTGLICPVLANAHSPLQPEIGKPICLKRVYSEAHMRSHPKQLLSSLYVELAENQFVGDDQQTYTTTDAKLVGLSGGEYYLNNNPGCSFNKDGTVRCGVDCDGGAFRLTPSKAEVLFSVEKNYYFPLFKNGTDQETAGENDSISLNWTDEENRNYEIYPVHASECEAAQKRAKVGNWGC